MTSHTDHPALHVHDVDDVAVVTLNRPERLNALDVSTRLALAATLRELGGGDGVRGIVLTGTGRAFSAGEDLTQPPTDEHELRVAFESFHDITRAILQTRVPVVAAINGLAVGGASEITLCCDARIGSSTAEFFQPENARGLTISNASSLLLRRLVGNHALRMVLGSERIEAQQAMAIGLLDEVVAREDLLQRAVSTVRAWTPPGGVTALHLELLRPDLREVEEAFAREDRAAAASWESGALPAGVQHFWSSHTASPTDEETP